MGASAINLLSGLEPILGVSVALNLAYLNIRKFHYISIVKNRLSEKLRALDVNVIGNIKNTPWFKQLTNLAAVEPLDLEWPYLTRNIWVSAPGFWGVIYNVFFYWRFGRTLSIFGTFYSLVLLIWGAGIQSEAISVGREYFNATIGSHFFWSLASATWPLISILAGEFVCVSAARFVTYQTDNLKTQARSDAELAVEALSDKLET